MDNIHESKATAEEVFIIPVRMVSVRISWDGYITSYISSCGILPISSAPWILLVGCIVSYLLADWEGCQREPNVRTIAEFRAQWTVGQQRVFAERGCMVRTDLTLVHSKENTWSLVLQNLGFKLVLNLLPLHLLLPLLLYHLQFCLLLLLLVCASLLPSCYYSSFLFFLNSFIMKYDMWSGECIKLEVWFKGLL